MKKKKHGTFPCMNPRCNRFICKTWLIHYYRMTRKAKEKRGIVSKLANALNKIIAKKNTPSGEQHNDNTEIQNK